MDQNKLRKLAGINEDKWSGEVKPNAHPPEGLFASGTKENILKWLTNSHKDLQSSMSSLNFYINRSGKNLTDSRKSELESVKDMLRDYYGKKKVTEDDLRLRRLAGLGPLTEESNEEETEESAEETSYSGESESGESSEESSEETSEDDLPTIVKKIAKKAEGLTGEELENIIKQVYDAGVEDGKKTAAADTEETVDPAEKSDEESESDESAEEVKESHNNGHVATTANDNALCSDLMSMTTRTINRMAKGDKTKICASIEKHGDRVFTYSITKSD